MLSPLLTLLALVAPLAPPAALEEDVAQLYQQAHAAADAEALARIWSEHPDEILYSIDADLEGSLAAWEADPAGQDEAAQERIVLLQSRALWGARIAATATGDAIFADYASAFVGWTDAQKRTFREGQATYGRAREALAAGDAPGALEQAVRCRELAEPLGDWWGTAMGLSLEGKVLAGMERFEEALLPLSRARLIYDQLGLVGAGYGVLFDLAAALRGSGRWERLLVVADAIDSLSDHFSHDEGGQMARELRDQASQESGRDS